MAKRSGKVVCKRSSSSRGWRTRRASGPRRGGGGTSDATSDEEYVFGEEEEEDGTSYDSCSSDASREEPRDADTTSCTEEEEEDEEEEYDVSDGEELAVADGRRPRTRPAKLQRGSRARPRRRSRIRADDDGDEDFAADDDGGEQSARPPVRRTRKNGLAKGRRRRRRKTGPRNSKGKDKREKAPVKKRRRRTVQSSDDADFVVDDEVVVEGATRKNRRSSNGRRRTTTTTGKRRRMAPISDDDDFVVKDRVPIERTSRKKRRKRNASDGRRRMSWSSHSDISDSDFDNTISEQELRDLQVGGPLGRRDQKTVPPVARSKEKGKGKRVDDLEKQTCGICLSEEQKGVIRGLLDCCAHYFCFACIMEWSKVESRCPLCKQRFKTVTQSARPCAGLNLRAAVKRIPKRDQVYQPPEEEARNHQDPYADVVCMECQQGRDDHLLLLCDICDSPAHTYCVGLGREVPEGNWYCDGCRPMDPGSSNSNVWESTVEQGTRNSDSLQDTRDEIISESITNCVPHKGPEQSATLPSPRQSPSGVGHGAFGGCHSSLGDYGTSSPASGFVASTVSRRRSIHEHIRHMLSTNRMRQMPEGVARNAVTQPSSVESDFCSPGVEQPGKSPINGMNERSNQPFMAPRGYMHPCTHSEVRSLSIVEGAKARVQSMVKNHLTRLTRDNLLERRDFKDIARRATHTILAACGVEHRRSMVAMLLQPPLSCGHLADGELTGLVKDCCSLCFSSFVGNIVQRLYEFKAPIHRMPHLI